MTSRDAGSTNFDPKHRIIGAVVIVALAVIFLPLILKEREPSPASSESGLTPRLSAASKSADTKVAVTIVTPPVRSNEPPKIEPVAPAPPAISSPVVGAPIATTPPAMDTPPRAMPVSTAPPAKPSTVVKPVTNGWVVQVGTFASSANAGRVQDKLRAMGQPVQSESVDLQGNQAVRVRVGPFRDKAAAAKAQERIQKETGMKVVVLSYP